MFTKCNRFNFSTFTDYEINEAALRAMDKEKHDLDGIVKIFPVEDAAKEYLMDEYIEDVCNDYVGYKISPYMDVNKFWEEKASKTYDIIYGDIDGKSGGFFILKKIGMEEDDM